ncbi:BRO family, N-terminal domain [Caminicella sporogenes DSM 14501]|uniref:BRO family, N-terminal domain n=1 Tax=Caminicella sporogenes DSM 14501 TaxID=1121266 RepID=A0A1M6MZX3_9FIRM|nr:ORF6C domain-containing protein [Caminicella sporogenes]RKD22425.1 hypothetical protein BET04_05175 [Caminicella sporogenes]SHJ88926.1 BRO family, N-terminal domain [Caminicella sporogenes DSM 14501]
MKNLQIIKSEKFGNVTCDFYRGNNNEIFMTAEQLGQALDYSNPRVSIGTLVNRNEYLKNKEFSSVIKLITESGTRETRVFTEDGIYEVTMLAKTEKAKKFRAWVRKILKSLRTGQAQLISTTGVQAIKLVNQQVGMLVNEIEDIQNRVAHLEDNMTIDFGQQKQLQDIAKKKAIEALGGKNTPAYKSRSIRTKTFSSVWKDFKDYFQIDSYRNTLKKDFEKAKQYLESWQAQGKLLREIEDCNNQIQFQEVS